MSPSCKTLKTEADLAQLMADSQQEPVFLFKHSSTCPISAHGWREFQGFLKSHPGVSAAQVLVIEDRPLSLKIAKDTAITHESPQVILFKSGKPVYHASHGDIQRESLEKALSEIIKS